MSPQPRISSSAVAGSSLADIAETIAAKLGLPHLSVSYIKIGDVQEAQGDLTGAMRSYREGLAIRDRLAKSDPGNAQWQYDLGISNERIGDVLMA